MFGSRQKRFAKTAPVSKHLAKDLIFSRLDYDKFAAQDMVEIHDFRNFYAPSTHCESFNPLSFHEYHTALPELLVGANGYRR